MNQLITEDGGDCYTARVNGDLLIVNRSLQAGNGDKVIASVNGSYTIKIFSNNRKGLRLVASNGKYAPREISKRDDFEIFGVVTHVPADENEINTEEKSNLYKKSYKSLPVRRYIDFSV